MSFELYNFEAVTLKWSLIKSWCYFQDCLEIVVVVDYLEIQVEVVSLMEVDCLGVMVAEVVMVGEEEVGMVVVVVDVVDVEVKQTNHYVK